MRCPRGARLRWNASRKKRCLKISGSALPAKKDFSISLKALWQKAGARTSRRFSGLLNSHFRTFMAGRAICLPRLGCFGMRHAVRTLTGRCRRGPRRQNSAKPSCGLRQPRIRFGVRPLLGCLRTIPAFRLTNLKTPPCGLLCGLSGMRHCLVTGTLILRHAYRACGKWRGLPTRSGRFSRSKPNPAAGK